MWMIYAVDTDCCLRSATEFVSACACAYALSSSPSSSASAGEYLTRILEIVVDMLGNRPYGLYRFIGRWPRGDTFFSVFPEFDARLPRSAKEGAIIDLAATFAPFSCIPDLIRISLAGPPAAEGWMAEFLLAAHSRVSPTGVSSFCLEELDAAIG